MINKKLATPNQAAWIYESGEMSMSAALLLTREEAGAIITRLNVQNRTKRLIEGGILTAEKAASMLGEEIIELYDEMRRVIPVNNINTHLKQFAIGETVYFSTHNTICKIIAIRYASLWQNHEGNVTIEYPDGKNRAVNAGSINKIPPAQ